MSRFDTYRNAYPNARLSRSPSGVLEVALHTDGGKLVFNGHTHEQFVDLFHQIGSDSDNRVVILTGSGDAFMDAINPDGFDFSPYVGTLENDGVGLAPFHNFESKVSPELAGELDTIKAGIIDGSIPVESYLNN